MQRQFNQSLIVLVVAILALLLLAAGVSQLEFQLGHLYDFVFRRPIENSTAMPTVSTQATWLQVLLSMITVGLFVALLIGLLVSGKLRREVLFRVLMVIAVVIFISMLNDTLSALPQPEELASQKQEAVAIADTPDLPDLPSYEPDPPDWLVWLASIAVAGGASWFVWRWLEQRKQVPELSSQLADEASSALRDLEAGGNLADIVLRCYREMTCLLSEQQGQSRDEAMTPREFELHLAQAGIRDEHIRQLTRLFERVRYGPAKADPQQEREATECLQAIVAHYGAQS